MNDQRRHHRQRIIRKRVALVRAIAGQEWGPRGHFAKTKPFDCSCAMCRGRKWRDERAAIKQQVERLVLEVPA